MTRVASRGTMVITFFRVPITPLISTHEPPSSEKAGFWFLPVSLPASSVFGHLVGSQKGVSHGVCWAPECHTKRKKTKPEIEPGTAGALCTQNLRACLLPSYKPALALLTCPTRI